ncbi:hypothetical protein WJX74_003223 [Apatococcus lobatus]|uniref:Proline dehydrogenase n=1 Tax=Apatococcus lobatus TaxID=904363 RepID=A0AAW1RF46_9CHLO
MALILLRKPPSNYSKLFLGRCEGFPVFATYPMPAQQTPAAAPAQGIAAGLLSSRSTPTQSSTPAHVSPDKTEDFTAASQLPRPHPELLHVHHRWQTPGQPQEPAQPLQLPHPQLHRQSQATAPDFNDHQQAFRHKTTARLLQTLAVFRACGFPLFVQNAMHLYKGSRTLIGQAATDAIVRRTFFKQFCGGECDQSIKPVLAYLHQHGIGPIINYAAEDAVASTNPHNTKSSNDVAEAACDQACKIFRKSIQDAAATAGLGFMAIKVSALGSPSMLKRASAALTEQGIADMWPGEGSALRPHDTPVEMLQGSLTQEDSTALDNATQRVLSLAQTAASLGNVRMMIDAEHIYMQPAIDAIALEAQRSVNMGRAVVLQTYQCYLKSTPSRLAGDVSLAARQGWTFGGKLVRGAYLVHEVEQAKLLGQPRPVHDSLLETHACYDRCVEQLMQKAGQSNVEMMVASHNQQSIEKAVALMQQLGISPSDNGVYFGQLYGMSDHLSFTLGPHGYQAYKVIPYGPIETTMPYLTRRAQENSDIFKKSGVGKELEMIKAELARRLVAFFKPSGWQRPSLSTQPGAATVLPSA